MSVLKRGLKLLDSLADFGDAGVTELARHIGTDPSQIHRALRVLQECGYVDQDPDTKKYRLSNHVVELASSQLRRLDVRTDAQPVLHELAQMTRHTTHLAVLSRGYAVIIEQVRGASSVSVNIAMGDVAPLHATALGKALLAHLDPSEIENVLSEIDFMELTPHSMTSEAQLRLALTEIRSRGYATDDEEAFPGVRCAAAPVFNWSGDVVAAIGVSGPAWEITPPIFSSLGQQVLAASSTLSRRLGYIRENQTTVHKIT